MNTDTETTPITPREAAEDLSLVCTAIAVAWALSRFLLYPALHVPVNAPVILRPISGFLAAWALLAWRGRSLRSLGLRRPASFLRVLFAAGLLYGVQEALSTWFVPWLATVVHVQQQGSFMTYIRSHPVAFAGWLAIGWVVGAFMEELLFRGFLLTRTSELAGGGAPGAALGVLGQAVLFGALHWYGGAFAFLHATVFAVVSGVAYLVAGRNLWPLVLVHGAWNTIGLSSLYFS